MKSKRFLFSIILAVAVYVGLFAYGNFSDVARELGDFRWIFLPAILGLTLFNYAVRWLKWEYYLRVANIRGVPWKENLNIFLAGLAMTLTPGKVGEWIKSYFLKEFYGVPVSKSAPIVLAERVTDAFSMVLLSTGGLFLFRQNYIYVIAVALFFLLCLAMFRFKPIATWSVAMARRIPFLHRHAEFIYEFYQNAYVIFSPKALLVSITLGFISWLGEGIAMYYVLLGLGAENSWELAVQGVFILSIASLAGAALPLPGGLGAAEAVTSGLIKGLVGLPKDAAAAGVLLIRICTLWFGVTIGIVSLVILTKRANARGKSIGPEKSPEPA